MTTLSPSFWLVDGSPIADPLESDVTCDVGVIGAGITGLSAALALADAGADVVVVESHYAGFGASGRSAGHLTPTIGKDLPSRSRRIGTAVTVSHSPDTWERWLRISLEGRRRRLKFCTG